jgi:hypothetical protein
VPTGIEDDEYVPIFLVYRATGRGDSRALLEEFVVDCTGWR